MKKDAAEANLDDKPISGDYATLLKDVKERIRSAQYEALKAVNKELISLYWDLGKIIVERQKEKTWGEVCGRAACQGPAGRVSWNSRFFGQKHLEDARFLFIL